MNMPEPDDSLLRELERQKAEAESERERQAEEEYEKAREIRPDWFTLGDMMNPTLTLQPEGFLANDEVFRRKSINSIFGPGGSYKTWFLIFMMGQLARGLPVFKIPSKKCRILFISEEMDDVSVGERLRKMYCRSDADEIKDAMGFRFQQNFDFYALQEMSRKRLIRCIETSNDPDVVFMDSLSDIHTGDENSNRDMGIVFGILKDVAILTNTCIVVIHHAGKASEFRKGADRMRGAAVIQNKCGDVVLVDPLRPGANGMPRSRFSIEKHRDLSTPITPFSFSVEDVSEGDRKVTVSFSDSSESEASEANIARLRAAVEELAAGDEVSREAVRIRMVDGEGWSTRRFEETLNSAVRLGVVKRRKEGRESMLLL